MKVNKIPGFKITKEEWLSSENKWRLIVLHLMSDDRRAGAKLLHGPCGFCEADDRLVFDFAKGEECQNCPLYRLDLCISDGTGSPSAYWIVADYIFGHNVGKRETKVTREEALKAAKKVLAGIRKSKPVEWFKVESIEEEED